MEVFAGTGVTFSSPSAHVSALGIGDGSVGEALTWLTGTTPRAVGETVVIGPAVVLAALGSTVFAARVHE
jgi:hypothetical protein